MNKEIVSELLDRINAREKEKKERGEKAALATVIKSSGSAPREDGAAMLIKSNGEITGTIGGGPVEKEVIDTACRMMKEKEKEKVSRLKFDLSREEIADVGGICGGNVEVLLEILNLREEIK